MNKTDIIMVVVFLITLAGAFAVIEPTYTLYDTNGIQDDVSCFGDGSTYIYCIQEATPDMFWRYDVGTKTFENVANFSSDLGTAYFVSCDIYNGLAYCSGSGTDYNNTFSIDLTTFTITNLAEYSYSGGYNGAGSGCAFKPSTDQLWCYGWNDPSGVAVIPVRYYDVSDNAWTTYTVDDNPYLNSSYILDCEFRPDTQELWCGSGYGYIKDEAGSDAREIWTQVNTFTNTTTYYNVTPSRTEASSCRWFEDVFYCTGGDDGTNPVNTTVYYDPVGMTNGTLNDSPTSLGWFGCGTFNSTTEVCLEVYDLLWGYGTNVYLWEWEAPCVEALAQDSYTCVDGYYIITYTDSNACGTIGSLPANNGTQAICGSLTPYDAIHSAGDIGSVVIDFVAEYGIAMIGLVSLIVVGGLLLMVANKRFNIFNFK